MKLICVTILCAAGIASAVEQNRVIELAFTSSKPYADPFNDIELDVVLRHTGGEARVPAFWAGGDQWRFRFSSPVVGKHSYASVCSDSTNQGLHDIEGNIDVVAYTGDNPLYRRGPIRVAADKKHFEHADGTPFFWLGDTWWMGLTKRLEWPGEFETLTKDRVAKGFTVVQIVAGLYPDMPAFDPRGANEAEFPWEKDYARINPAYFDAADRKIAHLADSGIAPCIVGAWGYHLPWLGVERMKKHWRYIIARWGAYPVFWCTAGEGAMPYYLSTDKPSEVEFQKRGWTDLASFIRKTDPFRRPISIHPTDLSRTQVTDPGVLDFEMLQTGHGDRASIMPTIDAVRRSRAMKPPMPTINSEVCYEGILNTCRDDVVRIVTWHSLLGGTAGHTYGANGIWQLNRKGRPYGKSPHGGNYGETPWDEAMNLPGSRQAGLAKKLLGRFEWWKFEPHPEWVSTNGEAITWGDWIWGAQDKNPAQDAPAERRQFRKTFTLPSDAMVKRAIVHMTADDRFEAFINGTRIGGSDGGAETWRRPQRFDIAGQLKPGENVLEVQAENVASNVPNNPAGFICGGGVVLRDGAAIPLASDASWIGARVIGRYGDAPWRSVGEMGGSVPPAAAGIAGKVRVIYVPTATPVRVLALERKGAYEFERFDPVTGGSDKVMAWPTDAEGSCRVDPPAHGHDWVLVVVHKDTDRAADTPRSGD